MNRLVAWILVFVVSCLVGGMSVTAQTAMRTIDKGAHSNVDDAQQGVARTAAEWSSLWRKHNYDKPAPAVDFSKEMVVAVFMGSRPTGGFTVEITSVEERDGKLVVTYRERAPAEGAITAQVLTAPFHIVAVPPSSAAVVFERQR